MTQIDYDKLPVKYVMENEILSDVFYPDDTLKEKKNRVKNKLENSDYGNFFMIILNDKTDKPMGIITFDEFMKLMVNKKFNFNKKFGDIMKKEIISLKDDNTIKDVLDLFESKNNVNIIPILTKNGKYIGKVRRNNINKKIDELLKSLSN